MQDDWKWEKLILLSKKDIDDDVVYQYGGGNGILGLWNDSVLANNALKNGKGNYSFASDFYQVIVLICVMMVDMIVK